MGLKYVLLLELILSELYYIVIYLLFIDKTWKRCDKMIVNLLVYTYYACMYSYTHVNLRVYQGFTDLLNICSIFIIDW